jgi:DNA-binding transcriptional MocR family regulator
MTRFSERIARLEPSPVRKILRAAQGKALLSLAGGLPAEECFPVIPGLPGKWQQYGTTEGEPRLRRALSELLGRRGLECPPERILVLNGSQQGIDLAAKLFVDPGTPVLVESPTYLAALQVFRLFGARLESLPADLRSSPDALDRIRAPLAYVGPTNGNPTGRSWNDPERLAFAEAADRTGTAVLEDDPYHEIGFGDLPLTPVCARLRKASWIYLGSFSKSFVPGLRMGFLAASADLFPHLERLKQAADLHSNRLSQELVLRDLLDPGREDRLDALRATYRARRDAFHESLLRHFPQAQWKVPEGGLFFWAHLKPGVDLRTFHRQALEAGVAFLPGEHCFAGEPELGWARLNFSHCDPVDADRALGILARVLQA